MAIELHKLTEYLRDLKIAYGESVYNGKPPKELNKIQVQIKHIERLIQSREEDEEEERDR